MIFLISMSFWTMKAQKIARPFACFCALDAIFSLLSGEIQQI
uniref:Uncharacterized protein n=1 Tax=Arundo donax TaxID=35708 RepID=A0A0A9AQJ5_ARUDO